MTSLSRFVSFDTSPTLPSTETVLYQQYREIVTIPDNARFISPLLMLTTQLCLGISSAFDAIYRERVAPSGASLSLPRSECSAKC
jgi:hypothetical protein